MVGMNGGDPMSRLMWVPVALGLLLSGCRATSIMVGVSEPDLATIRQGDQRSHVEKTLGKRLWRVGSAGELTYDIYQYQKERPAQPFLGATGLFMDYITLGMMEGNLVDVKEFEPAKQLSVAYDEHDRVRFVSQPWFVRAVGPCKRMRCVVPPDSGVPSAAGPLPVAGEFGTAPPPAIPEVDRQIQVRIDGHQAEKRVVELPPGRHTLNYSAALGGSVMLGPMIRSYDGVFADVELLSGRLYRLKRDRFYPGVGIRVDIFWIEDADSGEVLQCSRK